MELKDLTEYTGRHRRERVNDEVWAVQRPLDVKRDSDEATAADTAGQDHADDRNVADCIVEIVGWDKSAIDHHA